MNSLMPPLPKPNSIDSLFITIGRLAENNIWVEKSNLSGTRYSIQDIKEEFFEIIIEPIISKLFIYKGSAENRKLQQIRNYSSLEELVAVLKETYLK